MPIANPSSLGALLGAEYASGQMLPYVVGSLCDLIERGELKLADVNSEINAFNKKKDSKVEMVWAEGQKGVNRNFQLVG